ncbi:hypothetical protein DFA_09896 [Cavenderia fasciculata]|uniref:Uncharacterized protein n=1 Tax=Cavenderia fasciculata TaxID=261658 RepID=F4Q8Q4_CACFS|nr:uncharacterized protein DFA_09896 [Cavenderia fasciculata]EGG15073.1 hypothetical protein DFA_09896 [Cavenderia fasciculata]|eukprot:XP_004351793.1 hypothetical protein DFA_09896 [Cavenderia fasciculata]
MVCKQWFKLVQPHITIYSTYFGDLNISHKEEDKESIEKCYGKDRDYISTFIYKHTKEYNTDDHLLDLLRHTTTNLESMILYTNNQQLRSLNNFHTLKLEWDVSSWIEIVWMVSYNYHHLFDKILLLSSTKNQTNVAASKLAKQHWNQLCNSIATHQSMKMLILDGGGFNDLSEELASPFAKMLIENKSIQSLSMEAPSLNTPSLFDALSTNQNIRQLEICLTGPIHLYEQNYKLVSDMLARNTSITHFRLTRGVSISYNMFHVGVLASKSLLILDAQLRLGTLNTILKNIATIKLGFGQSLENQTFYDASRVFEHSDLSKTKNIRMQDINNKCYLTDNHLPNRIILKIIGYIGDNVDLVCLFFTCKRFFIDIRGQYSSSLAFDLSSYIKEFAHARPTINPITEQVINTSLYLQSFKQWFNNSLSNQLYITSLPSSSSSSNNNNNDSVIEKVVVAIPEKEIVKHLSRYIKEGIPKNTQSLSIYPLEKVWPNQDDDEEEEEEEDEDIPFQSIPTELLPKGLVRLSLDNVFKIDQGQLPDTLTELTLSNFEGLKCLPRSLKVLNSSSMINQTIVDLGMLGLVNTCLHTIDLRCDVIGLGNPNIFPNTLTSLTISVEEIPSPLPTHEYLFPPTLTNLGLLVDSTERFKLNLENLVQLNKLSISSQCTTLESSDILPPTTSGNLKILTPNINCYLMPSFYVGVEKLYISAQYIVNLPPGTLSSLKRLTLYGCHAPIPSHVFSSQVLESVELFFGVNSTGLLEQGCFPPSLTRLYMYRYRGPIEPAFVPSTLRKLSIDNYDGATKDIGYLDRLDKLVWFGTSNTNPVPLFAQTIKSVKYSFVNGYTLPTLIPKLVETFSYWGAGDKDNIISSIQFNGKHLNPNQSLLLPNSLVRLNISSSAKDIRLDRIILKSNVQEIRFDIVGVDFLLKIRRIGNGHVLLLEGASLMGGFYNLNNNNPLYFKFDHNDNRNIRISSSR